MSSGNAEMARLEWTPAHATLYDEYLAMRGWGTAKSAAVFQNEQVARRHMPNGQQRLAYLVPKLAPDQETLASLLAEMAILSHILDFTPPDLLAKMRALHAELGEHPMHADLSKVLRRYVEIEPGKRHDLRDNRIRFAVHCALEARIPATKQSREMKGSACAIVAEALERTGLGYKISARSVAGLWRARDQKRSRER